MASRLVEEEIIGICVKIPVKIDQASYRTMVVIGGTFFYLNKEEGRRGKKIRERELDTKKDMLVLCACVNKITATSSSGMACLQAASFNTLIDPPPLPNTFKVLF